mmetsp:Transcript_27814/g.64432  ORF Transcript_27814/g.64432 Transcript_27814/m.64432 type:complete len:173 (+) Transcript_27814:3-521(+)
MLPWSRWRNSEEVIAKLPSYGPVKEQDRDVPRQIFEDFVDEWSDLYRRDRSFLSRLVFPSSNKGKGIVVRRDMSYEAFSKALLDEAAYSAEVYSDTRQILNHNDPVSSARIYFNELNARARESAESFSKRHGRRSAESSEDEGEIMEDGEINEESTAAEEQPPKEREATDTS